MLAVVKDGKAIRHLLEDESEDNMKEWGIAYLKMFRGMGRSWWEGRTLMHDRGQGPRETGYTIEDIP